MEDIKNKMENFFQKIKLIHECVDCCHCRIKYRQDYSVLYLCQWFATKTCFAMREDESSCGKDKRYFRPRKRKTSWWKFWETRKKSDEKPIFVSLTEDELGKVTHIFKPNPYNESLCGRSITPHSYEFSHDCNQINVCEECIIRSMEE